jgi:hypothetical protein
MKKVIPLPTQEASDWSQIELAEFYRVQDALGQHRTSCERTQSEIALAQSV